MRPPNLPHIPRPRLSASGLLRQALGAQLIVLAFAMATLGAGGRQPLAVASIADFGIGPRAYPPRPLPARYVWPVEGPITSYLNEGHPLGIDIGLAEDPNAAIVATAPGVVQFAGGRYCCSYGYYVVIDHGDDITSLYGHLSEIDVEEGQVVKQGDLIGYGGDSGLSTSAHLHFEIRRGEDHLDPLSLLPQEPRDQSQARGDAGF